MAIQFTGIASGMDTKSIIAELMKAERTKVEKVEKDMTKVEWKKDIWNEMNAKLYAFYKESAFKFKSASTYTKKIVSSSDTSVLTASASSTAVNGTHTFENIQIAKGSFLTGDEITLDKSGVPITVNEFTKASDLYEFTGDITLNISLDGGVTKKGVTISDSDTMASIANKFKDAGLEANANFDMNFKRFFISSKNTGQGIQLDVSGNDAAGESLLNALGFGATNRQGSMGSNAEFTYNNTILTSASNQISVNGLTVTLQGNSASESITINQDIEGIYESVKTFITKYNGLMLDINEKLNAESARKFQPLTADEKEAMADDEIKLWEDKIKNSLLKNDNILSAVSSSMRNILTLSSGVDTTGFDYKTFSSLGIVTGDYSERGLLHIEGDEDDPLLSLEENKLKKAIEENPEGVMEFMTALGNQLYSDMTERMKSTSLSSALTFYSDKGMTKQVDDYEDKIAELEERLVSIEERYYRQFTAMEKAIQQSNSTSDWLSQQLGGM